MSNKYYLPKQKTKLGGFFDNLGTKIPIYGPQVGLTVLEITDIQALCAFGAAAISLKDSAAEYVQGLTKFQNAVLWASDPVTAWPGGFVLPTSLPPVGKAGVVPLISLQVGRIKRHVNYTKQMGEDLGIEGADQPLMSAADLAAKKPAIKVVLGSGGHPNVLWKKQTMDSVEIQVDRGDGKGWLFLAIDTEPDYLDTAALPAAGGTAVWKYRLIYRLHDAQVGQWSDEVKITVTGI